MLDLISRQVSGIYHNVLVIWFNNDITIMEEEFGSIKLVYPHPIY